MTTWLSLDEAAEYLKMDRSTLYRLAREGQMPGHKRGRVRRFDAAGRCPIRPRRVGDRVQASPSFDKGDAERPQARRGPSTRATAQIDKGGAEGR